MSFNGRFTFGHIYIDTSSYSDEEYDEEYEDEDY